MKILNIIQDNGSISYYSTEDKYPTIYQKITMKTWVDDSNESSFKEYPVSKIHIDRRKLKETKFKESENGICYVVFKSNEASLLIDLMMEEKFMYKSLWKQSEKVVRRANNSYNSIQSLNDRLVMSKDVYLKFIIGLSFTCLLLLVVSTVLLTQL